MPEKTKHKDLVASAKQRWIIERDCQELKPEAGLGQYERRGWRGFHHHATLCIAAYGFLVAERVLFVPSVRVETLQLSVPPEQRPDPVQVKAAPFGLEIWRLRKEGRRGVRPIG